MTVAERVGDCAGRNYVKAAPPGTFGVARPPAASGRGLALRACVECRISISRDGDRCIVRLAGRFGEAQVPELLSACSEPGVVQVDLSELVSADVAGLDALQRVRAGGAELVGVPGYIQMRIDGAGSTGPRRSGLVR